MRPLTALLGIVMGSAVALATGLLMTWIVILFLPADQARFAPEHAPLLRAVAVFTLFSAASAGSFYGELRGRSWRPAAHGATLVMLAVAVWMYWPK
ncbi:MAG TPA: hypothetical protein VN835_00720 [Steroidobacteraceae bacterium]|nr:hypothetical protein [Steroidobacteraceae bacterium]